MKNGDMPATPMFDSNAKPCLVRGKGEKETKPASGLTKRETMAMHILPSLIEVYKVDQVATQGESVVRDAVIYADLLLAELERATS